jgi:UDP-N-acetylmuramoyl-L-alanyl-D-glutamate--2,6-diaminopimelate ligase
MEDRYSAIRAAIGTAGPEDVVLLAGKGDQDWVEHGDEDGSVLTGWLDDRVEARNALSKLKYLKQIPKFNRDTLPWGTRIENLMETLAVDPAVLSRPGQMDGGLE